MAFVMILSIFQHANLMEVIAVQVPLIIHSVQSASASAMLILLNQWPILTNAKFRGLEMVCAMMSIIMKVAFMTKMIVAVIKVKHNSTIVLYANAMKSR